MGEGNPNILNSWNQCGCDCKDCWHLREIVNPEPEGPIVGKAA